MSKRICGRCKSENVIEDTYYGGTQYYLCESCLCRGDKEAFPEKTLFHQITTSPEVLAEKLVIMVANFYPKGKVKWFWRSTIAEGEWGTKEEAISATVAALKEVAE